MLFTKNTVGSCFETQYALFTTQNIFMSYILNIDTATDICSIAISCEGKMLSLLEEANNNHASCITLMIEDALMKANINIKDLAAVAMSNGPGSYTSLRVGTSTAKGICYALDIPLIAVDTLTSLAYAAFQEIEAIDFLYCPMIDARRMEVYMALFEKNDENTEVLPLKEIEPLNNVIIDENAFQNYFKQGKTIVLTGNGAAKCKAVINSVNILHVDKLCSAAYLIPLSTEAFLKKAFADVAYHTPQYLKSPNITTPKLRT
jgi:tRNA threonylcarbamoyladenosine biosynthesis protein TsaB